MLKSLIGRGTTAAGNRPDRAEVGAGRFTRRSHSRIFLAIAISVLGMLGFAMPAHASNVLGQARAHATNGPVQPMTWHSDNGACGLEWELSCEVEWTAGWPGGEVRAAGQRNEYELALRQTCDGGAWLTVAASYPSTGGSLTTPIVNPGKTCGYQAWIKTVKGGPWWYSNTGIVYLGD